jgi:hypothetical protein
VNRGIRSAKGWRYLAQYTINRRAAARRRSDWRRKRGKAYREPQEEEEIEDDCNISLRSLGDRVFAV